MTHVRVKDALDITEQESELILEILYEHLARPDNKHLAENIANWKAKLRSSDDNNYSDEQVMMAVAVMEFLIEVLSNAVRETIEDLLESNTVKQHLLAELYRPLAVRGSVQAMASTIIEQYKNSPGQDTQHTRIGLLQLTGEEICSALSEKFGMSITDCGFVIDMSKSFRPI